MHSTLYAPSVPVLQLAIWTKEKHMHVHNSGLFVAGLLIFGSFAYMLTSTAAGLGKDNGVLPLQLLGLLAYGAGVGWGTLMILKSIHINSRRE